MKRGGKQIYEQHMSKNQETRYNYKIKAWKLFKKIKKRKENEKKENFDQAEKS